MVSEQTNRHDEIKQSERVLDLAMYAGEMLLSNGAEIFRVEQTMYKIAEAYKVDSFRVYVISNGIFASVHEEKRCMDLRHIHLAPVHLGRVSAVNALSRDIVSGKYTVDEAMEQLKKIGEIPYKNKYMQMLWSGIGSGCFCYLFGGNFQDSIVSFVAGFLVYAFLFLIESARLSKMIINILSSSIATLSSLILFNVGMGSHINQIIIGAIIPLVPGVALTTSIRDFFNSDYLSGTIRLIDAVLVAFCIAIGVGATLVISQMVGLGGVV